MDYLKKFNTSVNNINSNLNKISYIEMIPLCGLCYKWQKSYILSLLNDSEIQLQLANSSLILYNDMLKSIDMDPTTKLLMCNENINKYNSIKTKLNNLKDIYVDTQMTQNRSTVSDDLDIVDLT
ncbi:hypothetical protein QKU48_gp0336 [Fadolivirus algeromassiliense]|jgi:hypothetical protein|uniref:Uncharacterized protein n=1 Tax=Fadolivirus FV1/VV64 TaxID=3070911 RepID=A0A7D3UV91_9VIRU|nr:hypothetical protein QKU48_gp0336 [Fadolivirus algeromassiliense]QKF93794.1 hypothetical protein Fadolivirus_1_336 [Fadolivirus FV1/VV64]